MPMNYYDQSAPRGGSFWNPGASGGELAGPGVSNGNWGGDTNAAGAAADPFAYTQGSLLTPWQGRFNSSGYGGGYSVPQFNPFNYADINYRAPDVGSFTERYDDPAAFRFADFAGPDQFKAPTAEEMQQDPGYQARVKAAQAGATAAGAHGGVLNTGGFAKGLARTLGDQASQEYGNVYNRRKSEWDTNWGRAKDIYGTNQGNTKQAFDTNVGNKLAAYQTRQNTWKGNADVGLQQGQLGWDVAQGTWDRNMTKARQGWQDQREYDQQVASAGAANANQQYERDLQDYNRARDEFWTNQDRQSGLLDRERNVGLGAAMNYGNQMMGGYGTLGGLAMNRGDATAAGRMGSANAWGNYMSDTAGTIGGLALYGSMNRAPSAPRGPVAPPNVGSHAGLTSMPGRNMGMPGPSTTYSGMPANGNPWG